MYKLADGSLSTDYKVGDEFEVVGGEESPFTKGSVIALFLDDETSMPSFELIRGERADGRVMECFERWSNLKRKQFTKADLKDGMVVTYRNSEDSVVFGECLYGLDGEGSRHAFDLSDFNNDMTHYGSNDFGIIKVSYMNETLWELKEETAEQKEIKRLYGVIEDAEKGIKSLGDIIDNAKNDLAALEGGK